MIFGFYGVPMHVESYDFLLLMNSQEFILHNETFFSNEELNLFNIMCNNMLRLFVNQKVLALGVSGGKIQVLFP